MARVDETTMHPASTSPKHFVSVVAQRLMLLSRALIVVAFATESARVAFPLLRILGL